MRIEELDNHNAPVERTLLFCNSTSRVHDCTGAARGVFLYLGQSRGPASVPRAFKDVSFTFGNLRLERRVPELIEITRFSLRNMDTITNSYCVRVVPLE